jgi:hypothetical protein
VASPKFSKLVTDDRVINMLQDNVARSVNPILANPLNSGLILSMVSLVSGANSINHTLGRDLIGWFIIRQRGPASIYDTQDTNPLPTYKLNLVSSAAVLVDLFVF